MRLLHVSLLSILALPITARATSITYTVQDSNAAIFQFVASDFAPRLPQYSISPAGGNLYLRPGEWTICALARVACVGANIGVTFGQAGGVIDDYDSELGTIFPVYLGNFNTDLTQLGTFPDLHLGTRQLVVALTNDPGTLAPEPSTWVMFGLALLLLLPICLRRYATSCEIYP